MCCGTFLLVDACNDVEISSGLLLAFIVVHCSVCLVRVTLHGHAVEHENMNSSREIPDIRLTVNVRCLHKSTKQPEIKIEQYGHAETNWRSEIEIRCKSAFTPRYSHQNR